MSKRQVDKEIQNITKQLVKKYQPEKIILFGSAAWGKFRPDSDLDFFIIKKNVPYYGIDRRRQLRRLVLTRMPCDFLVVRPSEVKERLKLGDPFIERVIQKGIVLYGGQKNN